MTEQLSKQPSTSSAAMPAIDAALILAAMLLAIAVTTVGWLVVAAIVGVFMIVIALAALASLLIG